MLFLGGMISVAVTQAAAGQKYVALYNKKKVKSFLSDWTKAYDLVLIEKISDKELLVEVPDWVTNDDFLDDSRVEYV
jgi:hypothetical protein